MTNETKAGICALLGLLSFIGCAGAVGAAVHYGYHWIGDDAMNTILFLLLGYGLWYVADGLMKLTGHYNYEVEKDKK